MRKVFTKKRVVLLAIAAVAAALAAGGYAYFTSIGSGSGNASVGSSANIVITNGAPSGLLYPGAPAVSVPVHLHNPGSGNEYVGTVSGVVEDNGSCLGSWFTVAPISYDAEVNAGATNDTATTIAMSDANAIQDACQGQTLTIDWSSN
jgi:hypothetical protein